jgi:YHS domain-containing protein
MYATRMSNIQGKRMKKPPNNDDALDKDSNEALAQENLLQGAPEENFLSLQGSSIPQPFVSLKDPICGMGVNEQSPYFSIFGERKLYFCGAHCKTTFDVNPKQYSSAPAALNGCTSDGPLASAIYTCPMHPEIRKDQPGKCPKCGMTLEPVLASLVDVENPELKDFNHRFWYTLPPREALNNSNFLNC